MPWLAIPCEPTALAAYRNAVNDLGRLFLLAWAPGIILAGEKAEKRAKSEHGDAERLLRAVPPSRREGCAKNPAARATKLILEMTTVHHPSLVL